MGETPYQDLLDARVHCCHMRKKWNPKMAPYIFTERKGIHIIDLNTTLQSLERAANAMRAVAKSGRKILFVATKKQARDIVSKAAQSVNMPYVTERWLGGMMTNFATIKRSVKKMQSIERILLDTAASSMTKKERLTLERERLKLQKVLSGIENLARLPAAIYVVDIMHEHLAIAEAGKLGIRTFAMVDTNSDPTLIDFPIPANDDASKSIGIITNYLAEAIREGLEERQAAKSQKSEPATAAAE